MGLSYDTWFKKSLLDINCIVIAFVNHQQKFELPDSIYLVVPGNKETLIKSWVHKRNQKNIGLSTDVISTASFFQKVFAFFTLFSFGKWQCSVKLKTL
jgi:hypothetical protein